ncbi:hypothetical protein GCM10011571_27070 [Marinithermofilum abyssi]|uniref:(2Fe-2S) ferredoxin n=1 Tax=Marinithermofilum abyssi TaxID=1571185 RepID=A0A8J2VH76_9BACL|nr:(2Fe-2S) ferredoxin domain-containing protein [Marinithermofilum abyssi]GGE23558.1 hypothetical protein GCM10011571_27070 [Marinithermofilum abyssi]
MKLEGVKNHLLLCNGASCTRNGAQEVTEAIRQEIRQLSMQKVVHTTKTLCNGRCAFGPIVIQYPRGIWYDQMTPERGRQLAQSIYQNISYLETASHVYDGRIFLKLEQGVNVNGDYWTGNDEDAHRDKHLSDGDRTKEPSLRKSEKQSD